MTRSLYRKILLPLAIFGLLAATALLYVYMKDVRANAQSEMGSRANTVIGAISYAAEVADGMGQLHRFVSSLASEDDIETIVIFADSPARIVASNLAELRNRPLAQLNDATLEQLLSSALVTRKHAQQFDRDQSQFVFAAPIVLTHTDSLNLQNRFGSVLIVLNAERIEAQIFSTHLKSIYYGTTIFTLLGILCWWLLNRYVVQPTASIIDSAKANVDKETSVVLSNTAPIELLRVAAQLNESFAAVRAAESKALAATAAKGEFLARMSHEIRTPMNGVMGMMEAMLATPLSPEQTDFMKTAYSSASSLLRLINDILDYSKIEAGKMEVEQIDFDVHILASQIAQLWGKRAEDNGVEFSTHIAKNVTQYLRGDPTRLNQVLTNLISNALKFTPQGNVTLRVDLDCETAEQVILRFAVEDTGLGMSDEAQRNLFTAFTQADGSTSRRFGGTGLGLAICRQLVELMKGAMTVKSALGSGSRFEVVIPFKRGQAPASRASTETSGSLNRDRITSGKVLVVDDNETNRKVIQIILRRLQIDCDCAHDGLDAVRDVKSRDYLLVLMDCHMPVCDGFEATTAIRRWEQDNSKPRLPIIAVTASAITEDRERCTAAGMDDFLAKPVTFAEVVSALERWLPRLDIGENTSATIAPDLLSESQASILLEANNHSVTSVAVTSASASTDTIDTELFDLAQLAEARDLFGDSLNDILDHLQNNAQQAFTAIDEALADGNGELLREAAHKFKGSLATLGASAAAEAALALETLGRAHSTDGADAHFSRLKILYQQTYQRLRQLAGPSKPKASKTAAR